MYKPSKNLILLLSILGWSALDCAAKNFTLHDGTLACDGQAVLEKVPAAFSLAMDPSGAGVFLRMTASNAAPRLDLPLGKIAGLQRFTSCHRGEPFWMEPQSGNIEADVRLETQWLLAETKQDNNVMLVPLMDEGFVFTLSGKADGLHLTGDTADDSVTGRGGVALFVSVGKDPYVLCDAGAKAVMKQLGTGKLRREKLPPDFINDFGWCTWDSFYRAVSADGVRAGLASFAAGQVEPRFLILDDGWQDYRKLPTGEEQLVSLAPNQAQFGGDLKPTVQLAKQEYKIKTFLVWHAFIGYWGGLNGAELPAYNVQNIDRTFSPAILQMHPNLKTQYWGHMVGVVPTNQIEKFYNDYHSRLAAQGVDGVKVDNQSMIEGVSHGLGGRVAVTRAYRTALESSVMKYFDGRLINCMANAMETYYCSPRSTLMRTSIDFWPKRPESHGAHLYCNAQVGMWFGEFMQPDWDMFQSSHAMGSFHAAGRAVSGGPVYVSDKPDAHNFELLHMLVLSDGTILRADQPGRPTRDCLFADVLHEPVLLKIFNYNRDCAVIGLFNSNYHADEKKRVLIRGEVSPADAPDLKGESFAGFAQKSGRVWACQRGQLSPIQLTEGDWEIISFAPIDRGVAILGLADKLNSTGAIISKNWNDEKQLEVTLRDGGKFIAWCEKAPTNIKVGGKLIEFTFDATSGRLSADITAVGKTELTLHW